MHNYSNAYRQLNKMQRLAVDTIEGPLLVLAGPGTGKTQLLSVRAASILVKRGVNPENILILTYTNSAAREMKERNAGVIGLAGYDIEVGTFHSFANSIIQESEEAKNYVGDKIQMNEVERVMAMQYILDNADGIEAIRPFRAPYTYLGEALAKIGELKRDGITPGRLDEYLKSAKLHLSSLLEEKYIKRLASLAIVYRMYEDLKEGSTKGVFDDRGRYDFDDMIIFATEALKNEKALRAEYQDEFKYVMVDEYQDTNGAQAELLFTLLDYARPNLCCVGDDDQSIYRFQGASVGNFRTFKDRFPDLSILSLKDNYRSSKALIEVSEKVIGMIPQDQRMCEKLLSPIKKYKDSRISLEEFTTENEELLYIVDKIKALAEEITGLPDLSDEERAHPYNNIAILVRKRNDILPIIDSLLQAGIPYATDGKEDISGEMRARQLLDVLDLAYVDPADYARKDLVLYKVLTADYFEIPFSDVLRFIGYVNVKKEMREAEHITMLSELLRRFLPGRDDAALIGNEISDGARFEITPRFARAARAINSLLSNANSRSVHAILLDFIKDAGIYKYILRKYEDEKLLRIRELRSLVSFVNMVKAADLSRPGIRLDEFMAELKTRKDHALGIQGNLVTMTQDGVRVLTAHSSKGQEFHSVIVPFCLEKKNWPAQKPPEKIVLPFDLFRGKVRSNEKESLKKLYLYDEARLFYVAITRARSNIIFTFSPTEDSIPSSYLGRIGLKAAHEPAAAKEESALRASLEKTDAKDPLIGTEDTLKDLVKGLTLNPTRINNYISCRRKFFYNDVLKLPGAKKKSLVFGNCVHKALEDTYREYQRTNSFPDFRFFRKSFERELGFQGVDKSIRALCGGEEQMKKLKRWYATISQDPVMPIGLERKLTTTIGDNIIFTGKYDKIEWSDVKRGLVRIIDYKTGKPDDHIKSIADDADMSSDQYDGYLRQLISYRLLFERDKSESGARRVSHGVLVFTEPASLDLVKFGYRKGDYITKEVAISDEMVADMETMIKNVWNDIKDLRFEKLKVRDKDKCRRCDFDAICWG